ncbi:MAG: sensor histidine kinase [Nautilia sp.]|nr:MAG: sensor histidine kinase [Nautilia sp.]
MLYNNLNNTIKTLEEHQNKLEEVIKNEVEKRIYQEKILLQQSKFATMGEMLDVIAHQWKQPINGLYLRLELLKMETEDKNLLEHIDEMQKQLDQMVETMNEFRSFFRDKEKKEFYIGDVVENVLHLMKDEIMKNKIEIVKNIESNFKIYGYPNEFKHLIISIITNSRDAFIERNINDRKIIITATEDKDFYYLKISDNAGGIPENIIDNIFELNVTTKEGGTGVGLYIASAIARKNGGELIAQNNKEGAEFIFKKRKE